MGVYSIPNRKKMFWSRLGISHVNHRAYFDLYMTMSLENFLAKYVQKKDSMKILQRKKLEENIMVVLVMCLSLSVKNEIFHTNSHSVVTRHHQIRLSDISETESSLYTDSTVIISRRYSQIDVCQLTGVISKLRE